MPNLDDLRVHKNPDLIALPPFFAGFPRLVEFHAFGCKLEELPADLARCKVLTKIMVSGNRLSSIPDAVARSAVRSSPLLGLISSVFTFRNRFTVLLPCMLRAVFTASQVLAQLDIGDNRFTEVPPGLSEALDLKLLFIQNNQISSLPPFLADLPQLNRLNIGGNPIDKSVPGIGELHEKLQELCKLRAGKFQGL
jgi:internalin A